MQAMPRILLAAALGAALPASAAQAQTLAATAAPAAPTAAADFPPPESYTAETTLPKLIKKYPFIKIAGSELPPSVRKVGNITYAHTPERDLALDLYLPARAPATPLPAIVFVHGGGWQAGLRDSHAPQAIRMAAQGFAGITITYRLTPVARYPAAVIDAKAAVRWVRAHAAEYGIDPDRIAIAGGSAGGQIAALAGVSEGVAKFEPEGGGVSSRVQAIVNIDGLSDFTSEAARVNEDRAGVKLSPAGAWFGGSYAQKTALWREASPTFYVNAKTPPILFIGSGQERFSVGRDEMMAKLKAAGVATEVVLFPDTPHSFWLFDPWLDPTVDATVKFLRAYMPARAGK